MKIFRFLFLSCLFFSFVHAYKLRTKAYVRPVPKNMECILGVNIGGTNIDFGFFLVESKKPVLLFSFYEQTKNISDFIDVLQSVLDKAHERFGASVKHCCIGSPGPRSKKKDFSAGGKRGLIIDAQKIKDQTDIKTVLVVNDFEIIGYGIDLLNSQDIIELHKGSLQKKAPQLIVGAGTGVGATYMLWDEDSCRHKVINSAPELGSIEFSPRDARELMFAQQEKNIFDDVMVWSDVLGDSGLARLRKFIIKKKYKNLVSDYSHFSTSKTFVTYDSDSFSQRAVDKYIQLYARFVRTACMAINPKGGVYIVGGIAAKQWEHFTTGNFLFEFLEDKDSKYYSFFSKIPVYLIKNYNVSLYGAVKYLLNDLELQ